jgi:hypothetical protein
LKIVVKVSAQEMGKLVAAIDNLSAAVTANTASTQALATAVVALTDSGTGGAGANDAAIQAAADQITANTSTVDAATAQVVALTPAPATPPPAAGTGDGTTTGV